MEGRRRDNADGAAINGLFSGKRLPWTLIVRDLHENFLKYILTIEVNAETGSDLYSLPIPYILLVRKWARQNCLII